ncbi:hypothetical protein OIU84_010529 [Salix udensis]|uniref:CCT domain-containing protein n=1 Tax=Salix udensis TaxID=889485 RepID=A0AAD6JKY2_9ROSI|nr:hypothetical protein OIU84_010529 [Salix udensis]
MITTMRSRVFRGCCTVITQHMTLIASSTSRILLPRLAICFSLSWIPFLISSIRIPWVGVISRVLVGGGGGGGGAGADSVVPVQNKPAPLPAMNHKDCFDIDFCRSNLTSFSSYPSHSLSHSVSSSSLDVGVVPDGNSMSDISYPFGRSINTFTSPSMPISGSSTNQAATQLAGTDREARVLRYRERRKNRKFEKTIRYASRKAYAETRPRIKGRFAKRTEMESDMDSLYNSTSSVPFLADTQYGVVPSF